MSSKKNKSKGTKKGPGGSRSDTSPPPEGMSDATPPITARSGADEAPIQSGTPPQEREFTEAEPREFVEEATIETKALYDDVVATPKEPEPQTPQTGDMADGESALPVVNPEAPLLEDGEGTGFFRSFFACCIGRK